MNKSGVIDTSLTKPFAKLFVRQTKSQLRLYDDPIADNWKDYIMNAEKVKMYHDRIVLKEVVKFSQ